MLKIAHISDFHLRHSLPGTSSTPERLSRQMPTLLEKAVSKIKEEAPDIVAVTGDLVDHPLYGMHDPACISPGERDLRLVAEIFAPLTCPVAFLYGNHDHPDSFRRVFADQPSEIEVKGHRVILFFDDEVQHNTPQRMGMQRERFLAALSDGDPRPQIHLQHYLTAPDMDHGYPMNYLEAESMKSALCKDPRIRLILSGHYHEGIPPVREGPVWFSTAPAFCERPHAFRILTLEGQEVSSRDVTLKDDSQPRRSAVFLDRDGNINPQPSYFTGPGPFELINGVGPALAHLKDAGYALVVVTNQTAVAHGYVTVDTVDSVNDKMAALLSEFSVELDGVYCRYHATDAIIPSQHTNEPETKPNPAMLLQAAEDLHLDLSTSFMIGDQLTDIEAGRRAGCVASILVKTGHGEKNLARHGEKITSPVAENLPAAVEWILNGSPQ